MIQSIILPNRCLEKNREDLKNQKEFETIYQLVDLFIIMFPVVERVIDILKKELKEI